MKQTIRTLVNRVGFDVKRIAPPDRISAFTETSYLPDGVYTDIFSFVKKIHYLYDNVPVPDELRIAGLWRRYLLERRKNQIRCLESGDVAEYRELQERMFFNELTMGLLNFKDYSPHEHYLSRDFLESVQRFEYLTGIQLAAVATPKVMPLWGLETRGSIIKYTDPWHVQQAYNISNLLNFVSSGDGDPPVIVDLGSGFGGMAEKLSKLHAAPLDIWLIDIPLNLITAYAFLCKQFYGRCHLVYEPEDLDKLRKEKVTRTRFVLIPTLMIGAIADMQISVLNNAGSFSEMDLSTIRYYLDRLCNSRTSYLIETNSNRRIHYVGHTEVPSSQFPIPPSHQLLSRHFPSETAAAGGRYVTSIYQSLAAPR